MPTWTRPYGGRGRRVHYTRAPAEASTDSSNLLFSFIIIIIIINVTYRVDVMSRSEFLAEAARLCQMDDNNVARVLGVSDEPPRVILEHGDASKDLKTFLRHRSSHTFSSTDSPTRLTSSPSRSATAALRFPSDFLSDSLIFNL